MCTICTYIHRLSLIYAHLLLCILFYVVSLPHCIKQVVNLFTQCIKQGIYAHYNVNQNFLKDKDIDGETKLSIKGKYCIKTHGSESRGQVK